MLLWLPRAALVKPERPLPWAPSALLAQLVEHLHGKEGVSGSSPEEGLPKGPANRAGESAADVSVAAPAVCR